MAFNSVRKSQLIVPYGVGAMIDFPEDTLMTAGLDFWPSEYHSSTVVKRAIEDDTQIRDRRLELRLSKLLKKDINFFLSPTEGVDRSSFDINPAKKDMLFFRFPTWLHCPNCKLLKQFPLEYQKTPRCDNNERLTEGRGKMCCDFKESQRPIMKPVRFLVACEHGHIDDFPWKNWVHKEVNPDCNKKLYFKSNERVGLEGVSIHCACGKRRSLKAAADKKALLKAIGGSCPGRRPWLGTNAQYSELCGCETPPKMILRGASSMYFPNVYSSILIPPYSRAITAYLDKRSVWEDIESIVFPGINYDEDILSIDDRAKEQLAKKAERAGFDPEVFIRTIEDSLGTKKNDTEIEDQSDEKFRFREYSAFTAPSRPEKLDRNDFDIYPSDMTEYSGFMSEYFERIVKVERLRETRAFLGFSRLVPVAAGEEKVQINIKDKNWLPAVEVRGEGIFIEFNKEKLNSWAATFKKAGSGERLNQQINNAINNGKINFSRRNACDDKFILIHTFSHVLIRQLTFECGYDASSLKERLYSGIDEDGTEMAGVLIYTASGDSEGSLGGLVERAKPEYFENTVRMAIEEAKFCSNDPICHETDKQGLEGYNVSACHACALLPETCCEHSNLLLDRRSLIGTFDDPEVGYFSDFDGE